MPVLIEVLGTPRAWRDGTEIALGSPQQRAVLALLAIAEGRPVPVSSIVAALWGANPPASATNVVQTYVKRLRRLLDPGPPARRSGMLPRVGQGYALQVDRDGVDLWRFRALVARARQARHIGDHSRVVVLLTEALELWTCRPSDELPPVVCRQRLLTLDEERWMAVMWLAEASVSSGSADEALGLIEEEAAVRPLDEQVHLHLMRVYHAVGRRNDGVRVYHALMRRLDEELGLRPGPELAAAYDALLRDERPRPENGPPPPPVPAQLPADIAEFAGRTREIGRILEALTAPSTAPRPMVIAGMGGMGKSALAVHAGHLVAGHFTGGQLYASLGRGKDRAREVLGMFLLALGVQGDAVPEDLDDRAALFRSVLAGRRVLLVLDDVADEAGARPLLPGSGTCGVLITSRSPLAGLENALVVRLGALRAEDSAELLGGVAGRERVAAEPAAAAEIAGLCAHVPLAVRVAGVRLATRPAARLARLAERLRDERGRLDQLVAGDLGVRDSLALSYSHLPEPARRAFRLLGLLPVLDFPLWMVIALTGWPRSAAESAADALVDAHLLSATGVDAWGHPRFGLHDLVRVYARELAHAEDDTRSLRAARSRLLRAWLARTLPIPPGLGRRVRPEAADNLLADPSARVTDLADAVRQGDDDLAESWLLAKAATGFDETPGVAGTALLCGAALLIRGRPREAERRLDGALALARASRHRPGEALAAAGLGWLYQEQGRYAEAATAFRTCLATTGADGDGWAHVTAWRSLGVIHKHERYLHKALDLASSSGSPRRQAMELATLGEHYLAWGRPEAEEVLRSALELSGEPGTELAHALAVRSLGELELARGRPDQAVERITAALQLLHTQQATPAIAATFKRLGAARWAHGDHAGARVEWRLARLIYELVDNRPRVAELNGLLSTQAPS